ncbi:MAG: helix-turn-helix domain-containing protein [Acidimicrobiia bacterium]
MTVSEAATRAGRHPETVRRWIRNGRLRANKVGAQLVIEERDLEEMLEIGRPHLPARWRRFDSGRPQPDWGRALAPSRRAI